MKTIKVYFSFALLSVICFLACDKVENPNEKNPNGIPVAACSGVWITKTNTLVSNFKKVLIEDYTGQKCGNCPPAAVTAESIMNQHPDSVIVMVVHAGGFAVPSPTGAPTYTADYRTSCGTSWDAATGFGISSAGNPNGMVNRKDYPSSHIKSPANWGTEVNSLIAPGTNSLNAKLDVTTQYDLSSRLLNVTVKSKFYKAYSGDVKLNVVLLEDSVIGMQKDYSAVPVDVNPYIFMNMNRGSLNGDWGDVIKNAPLVNDTVTKKYSCNTVNATFNDKHLSVVVFAYDGNTKEVIQTEKIKIR